MIARTWHARLTPGREADYETLRDALVRALDRAVAA